MDQNKRLYCFRRKQENGKETLLVGLEHWAASPDAAMHYLKLTMGYTSQQGWYALDVTDDQKFREWAGL
jgi:hypothetical protein